MIAMFNKYISFKCAHILLCDANFEVHRKEKLTFACPTFACSFIWTQECNHKGFVLRLDYRCHPEKTNPVQMEGENEGSERCPISF